MSGWGQGNDYSQQGYGQQPTANQFAAPQQQVSALKLVSTPFWLV